MALQMRHQNRYSRIHNVRKTHMTRRQLPSLNALRAFEAAGRLGRMTLAAEELSVTHGAVSRQVGHLEELLGVKLFAGPKNNMQLTDAGHRLLASLTSGFDQLDWGVRAIADKSDGALDVSCLSTFTMRWLIPRLFRFKHRAPDIDPRLSASAAPVNFERESYEVAIRVDDHPIPSSAEITTLFPEYVGPVLSPGLADRLRLGCPGDYAKAPLLHTKTRPHAWYSWVEAVGAPRRKLLGKEFEHFYFMLEAATAGLGVCIASWPLVIDDISAGRLVAPFGFSPSGQRYVAVRRKSRNQKAQNFCQWLEEEGGSTPSPPRSRHL
jgi:LysR family glycine cleavage system transcriptional activator